MVDIPPVEPIATRFNVHIAERVDCGKRVQGRHAEQISGALGAAAAIIWTASSKAVWGRFNARSIAAWSTGATDRNCSNSVRATRAPSAD